MRRRVGAALGAAIALLAAGPALAAPATLIEVDVLPPAETQWVARLTFDTPPADAHGFVVDDARYAVDISSATWPGKPVARPDGVGGWSYRWSQSHNDPPTVRFVVERPPGWACSAERRAGTVELRCLAPGTEQGSARPSAPPTPPPRTLARVARVRGLDLSSPLESLDGSQILARSLEYLPRDVIHDGLPHFSAVRDDWKGTSRPHKGLDIYVDDCAVTAMAAGKVVSAGTGTRAGGWLKIDHGSGVETVYVHVRDISVRRGGRVSAGQQIARIDGPVGNAVEAQLHLEIKLDGQSVDPAPFFVEAADASLAARWRRAIAAIPERVEARRDLLETTR